MVRRMVYSVTKYAFLRLLLRSKCVSKREVEDFVLGKVQTDGIIANSTPDSFDMEFKTIVKIWRDKKGCIEERDGKYCLKKECISEARRTIRFMENEEGFMGDVIRAVKRLVFKEY